MYWCCKCYCAGDVAIVIAIVRNAYVYIYIYWIWYILYCTAGQHYIYKKDTNRKHILTNIGHRFVHHSGAAESSNPKSAIYENGLALRAYLQFYITATNTNT